MTDSLKLTIEEFRSTMRLVTKQDAAGIIGVEVQDIGASCVRIYHGNMFIEDYGAEYEGLCGKRFWTVIERSDWFEPSSKLGTMEQRLYEWLCGQGSIYDPVKAAKKKQNRAALFDAMREVAGQLRVINEICIDDDDLNEELFKLNRPEGCDQNRLLTWSADEMAHEWIVASETFDDSAVVGGEA